MSVVRIRIERLVLDGFDGIDGTAVGQAIEHELGRLLRRRTPACLRGREAAEVDGGAFTFDAGIRAPALGRHVARAAARGIA